MSFESFFWFGLGTAIDWALLFYALSLSLSLVCFSAPYMRESTVESTCYGRWPWSPQPARLWAALSLAGPQRTAEVGPRSVRSTTIARYLQHSNHGKLRHILQVVVRVTNSGTG